MAERTKAKGFCAPCPRCGEEGVRVSLLDVDDLHCNSCEEDFTLADVRALVEGWGPVIRWLDTCPDYPDADEG